LINRFYNGFFNYLYRHKTSLKYFSKKKR